MWQATTAFHLGAGLCVTIGKERTPFLMTSPCLSVVICLSSAGGSHEKEHSKESQQTLEPAASSDKPTPVRRLASYPGVARGRLATT